MTRAGTIRLTAADQRRFATLSGDFNPVHLDPLLSRRVAAGQPIVHGMHLLLRALDLHFASASAPQHVEITATFLRPAFVEEAIYVESNADGTVAMHAKDGVALVTAQVRPAAAPAASGAPIENRRRKVSAAARTPKVRTLADAEGLTGVIELAGAARTARTFPRVARALGPDAGAAIAAISRLVGMECPGRDSLLSAIRLHVTRRARVKRLAWRVIRADRRFGLVRIELSSDALRGTVDAFVRPQPTPLPTMRDARARVTAGEFSGQRALVVGGSRGLGAATAMLIAAGGGLPIVTYAVGADEAAALQRDARSASRRLDAFRLDVLDDQAVKLAAEAAGRFRITHLYYYATPRIFARRCEPFDDELFERFARFYVNAFARLCLSVAHAVRPLDVFYPSSVAVEQPVPELTEYAAAKAAGEWVCRGLERPADGLRILVRRLPRTTTDQTTSMLAIPALDPYDVVLPIVRELQRQCPATRHE